MHYICERRIFPTKKVQEQLAVTVAGLGQGMNRLRISLSHAIVLNRTREPSVIVGFPFKISKERPLIRTSDKTGVSVASGPDVSSASASLSGIVTPPRRLLQLGVCCRPGSMLGR